MRSIKRVHKAESRPIGDLKTYSPLPSSKLRMIDPFLLLNHHGPQVYSPDNDGLPFGPHPHRGIETVTFIIEGDIVHKDSEGHSSTITSGGIQWMTAGKGVIHAETSSEEFKKSGGPLEILQLWINLPAKHKMTSPFYKGLQSDEIPSVNSMGWKIKVIAGNIEQTKGAIETISDITLTLIEITQESVLTLSAAEDHTVFFYVVRGSVDINNTAVVDELHLAEFNNDGNEINLKARKNSVIIFGHAKPFNEPVVAHGPFVMNTQEEIMQAYSDYKLGRFGTWTE